MSFAGRPAGWQKTKSRAFNVVLGVELLVTSYFVMLAFNALH